MEITGTIIVKKVDNKAFKMGENWYNCKDSMINALSKFSKGDTVTVTYDKKGVSNYVTGLAKAGEKKQEASSSTGFACEVCGKALKDGKFKKCFVCNKEKKEAPVAKQEEKSFSAPETSKASSKYESTDRSAQIQRGNALNAAAAVAGGQKLDDPETAAQFTLILAERFLEWLRAE